MIENAEIVGSKKNIKLNIFMLLLLFDPIQDFLQVWRRQGILDVE